MSESWDDRLAELFERMMAIRASGGDPRPLQKQFEKLMAEMPEKKKDNKNGTSED